MIKIILNQVNGGPRDKQRFWYGIWRSCGRPRQGQVYTCYKAAKKLYRAACKQAMNCNMNRVTHQLNSMYRGRDLNQQSSGAWYSAKRHKSSHEDITISSLKSFFRDKFKQSTIQSDVILNAELEVQSKLGNLDFIM